MSTMGALAVGSQMGNQTSSEELPPPPPPKESSRSAAVTKFDVPAPAPTPSPGPPRLKTKVPWKGKNIAILLPWDDERGQKGKAPTPMSEKDVTSMLRNWEQLGYDTVGFNLGPSFEGEEWSQGQSRGVWPYAQDILQERAQHAFRVSIPDRREWEAYVQELNEAKLRALGVTLGDEEPTVSPAASNMSRRTSMQYPALPFSPPIPTSSAGSSHIARKASLFSPPLVTGAGLSTGQSSHPGSVASPASMHALMHGKFNPRHSVSFGGDHPFGSPFQYPQQSPGGWSPQQAFLQQGMPRGGSPAVQALGPIMSPSSPFSQDGYFPHSDIGAQLQQRQTLLLHQQQLLGQAGARDSPRLQEVREADDEDQLASKSPSKTPEARQIKHNPSDSLQKEIDDAEYHLEEQFQRQLDHDDYSPHSDKGDAPQPLDKESAIHIRNTVPATHGLGASRYAEPENTPVLHHPQPHSRGHSLSQRPFQDSEDSAAESKLLDSVNTSKGEVSEMETNPSELGTPQPQDQHAKAHDRSISVSSNPWTESESVYPPRTSSHGPKPSISKLNVAAKEFKFDPTNAFMPSNFSFGSKSFEPSSSAYSTFSPSTSLTATSSHLSNQSIGNSKSKINVAAPAFTPGQSEFSFSSSGPTFRPDAPTFEPKLSAFSASLGSGTDSGQPSLFGNIDLSTLGMTKPSKKSKAIPIVRPDSSHSRNSEDEVMEGKDGRITQGEGRIKRARGGRKDGDSIPLFAEPSMPLGETSREQSPPKEAVITETTLANKENSVPSDNETLQLPPASAIRDVAKDETVHDYTPFEFHEQKQAEDFNAARPFTSRRYGSGLPAYGMPSPEQEHAKPVVVKAHKKNSLSATAKPFEFKPSPFSFSFDPQVQQPQPAVVEPPALPVKTGLSASRYASSPPPEPAEVTQPELHEIDPEERSGFQDALPGPERLSHDEQEQHEPKETREPTFEEIDAVMRHLNEAEMESASREADTPRWHQPSPTRRIQVPDLENSSPIRLQPQNLMRSDAPSPSPRRFPAPIDETPSGVVYHHQDPFAGGSPPALTFQPSPVHRLNNGSSLPASDWDDVLSETEEAKLQPRARFFDSHVNNLVGGLLAERIDPLERTLETIQMSLEMLGANAYGSRRDKRSVSGALSDADDEDDDVELPRRSLSPRRDKKMEKIRSIVNEALAAHSSPQTVTSVPATPDLGSILQTLEEMKDQFGQSMRLDLRGEDLRNIVEDAVERRMPMSPKPAFDESAILREAEYKAKVAALEEQLQRAESKPAVDESAILREVEYKAKVMALEERLQRAESKPVIDEAALVREAEQKAKLAEFEKKIHSAEARSEEEVVARRAAEDRLAEVQRLLRISAEEEMRLRDSVEERDVKIREISSEGSQKLATVEKQRATTMMRIALLEATHDNAQKSQAELANRVSVAETELRESRKEVSQWQMEAERALDTARRHNEDVEQANETNKDLRRTLEGVKAQMEESIRVREGMRGKLMDLQEDMAKAARDISEENSRRAKKEQEMLARQEVLDARLQAEARTRERLEREIERLEAGEREGMRAVRDCEKLETLVAELRLESHNAQKDAMKYKREFEEARESGMSELQRTRHFMQAEIETANNQVNVAREDLENQVSRLRVELEQIKMDAETEREKHAMLLEEANGSKKTQIDEIMRRHANEMEDVQTRHNRQLSLTVEDSQRAEQLLLERLSLSTAKTEHLQDRVQHLEEKLEIAQSAANAAAVHAKSVRKSSIQHDRNKSINRMELPEKISPQALRESIMVLQEQLQDREQSIERLEQSLSLVDPEASIKISKRDDEIMWLRELLAVRKSDLEDVISTLQTDDFDMESVRDAAIRLNANLQMEEQERERAMNGGSALNLPNIAASLRDAATPRVAQAVGPLAAAWGNWRKGREDSLSSRTATPNKSGNHSPATQSFLSGLLTPPASSARTPSNDSSGKRVSREPTAFASMGQRMTAPQSASRQTRNLTPRKAEKMPMRGSPRKPPPATPPMLRRNEYDGDARAEEFSDAGYYDDDESVVEGSLYGVGSGVGR